MNAGHTATNSATLARMRAALALHVDGQLAAVGLVSDWRDAARALTLPPVVVSTTLTAGYQMTARFWGQARGVDGALIYGQNLLNAALTVVMLACVVVVLGDSLRVRNILCLPRFQRSSRVGPNAAVCRAAGHQQ